MARSIWHALNLGICLVMLPLPSWSQSALLVGTLDATAHRDIKSGVSIRVRKPDHSLASDEVAELFVTELAKRGHAPGNAGVGYTLAFKWRYDTDFEPAPYPMVELPERDQNPSYDEEAERLIKLGKANIDKAPAPRRGPPRILLIEVVNERSQLVWSGRATALRAAEDTVQLAKSLIPSLMDYFGTSSYDQELK